MIATSTDQSLTGIIDGITAKIPYVSKVLRMLPGQRLQTLPKMTFPLGIEPVLYYRVRSAMKQTRDLGAECSTSCKPVHLMFYNNMRLAVFSTRYPCS